MSGDFESDLEWSHDVAGLPFWLDVYRKAFPGFVAAHIPVADGWHQRAGRDRIIVLDDSSTITVDEKGRREVWPDILVEIFSDRDKQVPGWGNPQKRLNCDYIGYAFIPTATCYLLPYRELIRTMKTNAREWWVEAREHEERDERCGIHFVDARNPRNRNQPLKYYTRSMAIPTDRLLDAIRDVMTIKWADPLLDTEAA
jgi:hypothetical protein